MTSLQNLHPETPAQHHQNPSQASTPESSDSGPARQLPPRKRGWTSAIFLGVLVVAGIFTWPQIKYGWSQISFTRTADQTEGLVKETAKKGTFQITVVEKGTLDSMKNAVLSSKVEGSTTIISIVPEGSSVKTGDLVCELDASLLSDKETQQEIAVEKAKASLEQGREDLKIQEAQNESDIEAAKLKFKLAEIDLVKYREGDLVQQKNDLESQVKLAEQNVARAQESYEYVMRLTKIGYRTQNDLDSERIAVATEKIKYDLAKGSMRVLSSFTEGRTFAELDANVKEFGREIQRTESKTRAALAQKKAELRALELTFEVESKKYERLMAQITACKLYATQDGQVVYANTRDGRATDQVLIEVGVPVRERQAIINLPDLDLMKVNARIHESRISMVIQGMTAIVKVDAFPNDVFHGMVDSVASVPSSTGGFGNNVKEYEAVIKITDDKDKVNKLRPGLNASVEILVERREDVLQIPMQANVTVGAKQFVFAVDDKKVAQRSIKVGKTNANFIEVLEGLSEGDQVVMNPQTHFKKEIGELEIEQAREQAKATVKAPDILPIAKPVGPPTGANDKKPGDAGRGPGSPRPGGGEGVRPAERPGNDGSPSGPPAEGGRPPGSGGGGGFDPMAFFDRMDKDQNGKVSKDEAEGRFAENFEKFDTDSDGSVTKEEFQDYRAKNPGRGGGGGGGRPRPQEGG